jgi:hypothetical protein
MKFSLENFSFGNGKDISGMEECKIPSWARDKMFWHQPDAFSYQELKFSLGGLKIFVLCSHAR